jgi:AraC-like DNA-binding protein
MKTAVHKSRIPDSLIFVVKDLHEKHFDPVWHSHSEYQLFVVLEGTGTRFIGDSIVAFKPGELILTGPHLPHLWRSDEKYFKVNSSLRTKGIVIYMDEHFLGQEMMSKVEMHRLKILFDRSMRGLEFYGESKLRAVQVMKELLQLEGIPSLIHLLQILDILSTTKEFRYISSRHYSDSIDEHETDRLNKVYHYVIKNYRNKIPLEKMAELLHMTPTSFSRYFSMMNNKTYSRFVAEIRIKHACELLTESDMSVAEICYECGFNTLSNFNKQFKDIMHKKPSEYKKEFLAL